MTMDPVLMSLFNPRGDGTLRSGDLMYDIIHGTELVTADYGDKGWVITGHHEVDQYT
jgi:hypothetical protein